MAEESHVLLSCRLIQQVTVLLWVHNQGCDNKPALSWTKQDADWWLTPNGDQSDLGPVVIETCDI